MEKGYTAGETCNRHGCQGILEEYEKEGCCSCHINPPCSFCTADSTYCPECDWSAEQEEFRYVKYDTFKKIEFKRRNLSDLDNSKIDWISRPHTHFSMIKEGVYPETVTDEQVEEKVKGTFGGRFEYFGGGKFKYIAYTD